MLDSLPEYTDGIYHFAKLFVITFLSIAFTLQASPITCKRRQRVLIYFVKHASWCNNGFSDVKGDLIAEAVESSGPFVGDVGVADGLHFRGAVCMSDPRLRFLFDNSKRHCTVLGMHGFADVDR